MKKQIFELELVKKLLIVREREKETTTASLECCLAILGTEKLRHMAPVAGPRRS